MFGDLYNTDILTLAASVTDTRLDAPCATARAVSKLCGSELEIDLDMDGGKVSAVALRVRACALGQASAGILQNAIIGASVDDISAAHQALEAMLKSGGPAPQGRFAKLSLLKGVTDYPARHTSTLLAFKAAQEAARECQS
ncbi:iron-sulfur cluster assembly scaffold protein [Robiginitomaculum antarcticum]|uniref:iron-sulfur cluster assembly scaffold protein n=1 Tax=Robiginitomaculum antarcticum TaxID=437507 RepID=UPI000378B41F|nr:iron-sulfur cluster assembly scaffold protein [Robiginitomaculum antarcticum]